MENQKIQLGVSEFVELTNQILEGAYPSISVVGEVASFKVNQSKFVFFDLKDDVSTLNCFMMVWQLRAPVEEGMQVVVTGTPKLTAKGRFSLTVRSVQPVGEGSLKKSFQLLHDKLDREGLFEPARKRPLPVAPERVAVISSTQAAGYADFIEVVNRRWGNVALIVAHTAVQGEGAADQIIRAIDYFSQTPTPPEVLVIVRGGGSADDLAVFNDELLVRAVASSRIPTLVGVGHEVDTTLVDLAADVRAATPTHAAQILVPDREAVIEAIWAELHATSLRSIDAINMAIESGRSRILDSLARADQQIEANEQHIRHTIAMLNTYDPQSILARGYAIIRGDRSPGAILELETIDQRINAEVRDVKSK